MLIEDVRVVLVAAGGGFKGGTNCMVQIQTDTGIIGTGQSGTWAYPEAVASVVAASGHTSSGRIRCGSSTTGSTSIEWVRSAATSSMVR